MQRRYDYLIIGGGMTADSAVGGIREIDQSGSIGLVTMEGSAPYKRPPLSKGLWKGDPLESIWLDNARSQAEIHSSRTAGRIDPKGKTVVDDQGDVYAYEKLLLATGGETRRLPFAAGGIVYYRTVEDFALLKRLAGTAGRFVIIGGGFIGTEVAAALAMNKKQVTMVFPEQGIGERIFPRRLSSFLTDYYRSKGVVAMTGEQVANVTRSDGTTSVTTSSGKKISADAIIAGIGMQPNVALAQAAGLEVNNGIVVNEYLQTTDPHVFSAGDVANFFSPVMGNRMRVEHEDNALSMGKTAGRNMAGAQERYSHLPFFYSDLFDLGYEAVGELDSRLEMVEDWKEEFREGVVYYLRDGVVRGVLLWNTWGQVDNARKLIAEKAPMTANTLKGRLPA